MTVSHESGHTGLEGEGFRVSSPYPRSCVFSRFEGSGFSDMFQEFRSVCGLNRGNPNPITESKSFSLVAG